MVEPFSTTTVIVLSLFLLISVCKRIKQCDIGGSRGLHLRMASMMNINNQSPEIELREINDVISAVSAVSST